MTELKSVLFEVLGYQLFMPKLASEIKKLPTGKLDIKEPGMSGGFNKPYGAFWTSSWKGRSSEWSEWVDSKMPHWKSNDGILLKVSHGAKVYTVKTLKDYEDIHKRYGFSFDETGKGAKRRSRPYVGLNWKQLSKSYDGFQVVSPRVHKDLEYWDAESTAWFNMNVLTPVKIVSIA